MIIFLSIEKTLLYECKGMDDARGSTVRTVKSAHPRYQDVCANQYVFEIVVVKLKPEKNSGLCGIRTRSGFEQLLKLCV